MLTHAKEKRNQERQQRADATVNVLHFIVLEPEALDCFSFVSKDRIIL